MGVAVVYPPVMRAQSLLQAVPTLDDHRPGLVGPALGGVALLLGVVAALWMADHPTVAVGVAGFVAGGLATRGHLVARLRAATRRRRRGRTSTRTDPALHA